MTLLVTAKRATLASMVDRSWRGVAWAPTYPHPRLRRQGCRARRASATGPYKATAHLLFPLSLLSPFILGELEVSSCCSLLSLLFLPFSICI